MCSGTPSPRRTRRCMRYRPVPWPADRWSPGLQHCRLAGRVGIGRGRYGRHRTPGSPARNARTRWPGRRIGRRAGRSRAADPGGQPVHIGVHIGRGRNARRTRATTHWRMCPELARRFPRAEVNPNVLFVGNGRILTSAGAAAGIDLCLHLVRRDHGAAVANATARACVVAPWREGARPNSSSSPCPPTATRPPRPPGCGRWNACPNRCPWPSWPGTRI